MTGTPEFSQLHQGVCTFLLNPLKKFHLEVRNLGISNDNKLLCLENYVYSS